MSDINDDDLMQIVADHAKHAIVARSDAVYALGTVA
jgi:hypothetical protein